MKALAAPGTWQRSRRWAVRGCVAVVLLGILLGSLEVRRQVRSNEQFYLDNWVFELDHFPQWVTPEIHRDIAAIDISAAGSSLSLFEAGVLDRVRDVMEASPWIRDVEGIRLRYPNYDRPGVLDMQLHLRTPVALVEREGLYYLTDREFLRLGEPYDEAPTDWFRVPAIVNIPEQTEPLPEPGEPWLDPGVQQGVAVARALHDWGIAREFPDRPIRRIDLSNLHGREDSRRGEIVLYAGSLRLIWGRSPLVEPRTVEDRLLRRRLRAVLSTPEEAISGGRIHLDDPNAITVATE